MIKMQNKVDFDFKKLKVKELRKIAVREVLSPLADKARKESLKTFKTQKDIEGNEFKDYTEKSKWPSYKKKKGLSQKLMIATGKLRNSMRGSKGVKTNMTKITARVGSNIPYGHYHLAKKGEEPNNVQRKWFYSSNEEAKRLLSPEIQKLKLQDKYFSKFTSLLRTKLRKIGKSITSK